jgi:hypothetical protein
LSDAIAREITMIRFLSCSAFTFLLRFMVNNLCSFRPSWNQNYLTAITLRLLKHRGPQLPRQSRMPK